jgi:DNA (cytosine-5)-methyltransferase 1
MASLPQSPTRPRSQTAKIMSRISSAHTEPEKIFRKALRKLGTRAFTLCDSRLPGKPDVVLPGKRTAIFIDGDFWHGNQYRLRGFKTQNEQLFGVSNFEYWSEKISRNVARDFRNTAELLESGWRVLRFWESDIRSDVQKWAEITVNSRKNAEAAAFGALPGRTVVELFAGIGLVRLALDRNGWSTVFANDNDAEKFSIYRENFGAQNFDTRSVHCISGDEIPPCALMTASFPCNDLSLAGARAGLNGEQSSAFWQLIRLLKEMDRDKPPMVLLENVAGFLTSHGGADLESALLALNKLGYSCDLIMMDASWFVPQSRVRLFVVASHGTRVAKSRVSVSVLRPKSLTEFIESHPNIDWAIRSLPGITPNRPHLDSVIEILEDHDARWWNKERSEYFLNQLSRRHRAIADQLTVQPRVSYATAFRRVRHGKSMAELRVDGMAGCLRTPRGGSGRQILFEAGNGRYRVRLLTPRECARLQGVPDDAFRITVGANKALFGFGDAVCVPVIEWIADNYLNPLASELMRGRILKPPKS